MSDERVIRRGHIPLDLLTDDPEVVRRGRSGDGTPTNPAGSVGSAGGFPGSQGEDGEDGAQGPPGPPGADGTLGMSGPDGAQGPPGPAGEDGLDGEPGPLGDRGPVGSAGPTGDVGPPGFPGLDGEQGEEGSPGPPGTQGAPGPTGEAGQGGFPGTAGEDGEDGATIIIASGASSGMFLDGTGNPQGNIPAPVGAIYMDRATGRMWVKMGGASTKFGWYRNWPQFGGNASDPWCFGFVPIIDSLAPNNQGSALHSGPWTGSRTSSVFETASGVLTYRTDTSGVSGNVAYIVSATEVTSGQFILYDWDIVCRIATPNTITSQRQHVGMSTAVPIDAENFVADATASSHIGFRWSTVLGDTGWTPQTKNGASNITTGTALNTIVGGAVTPTVLRIRKISNVCYFSVDNGTEQTISTNVPTTGSFRLFQAITTKTASVRSCWTRSHLISLGVQ